MIDVRPCQTDPASVMRHLIARGKRCLLCGGLPVLVGLYAPADHAGVRAPKGKTRALAYLLCDPCSKLSDAQARVEALVNRDIAQARAEAN
jgi:hypothetical protein